MKKNSSLLNTAFESDSRKKLFEFYKLATFSRFINTGKKSLHQFHSHAHTKEKCTTSSYISQLK